jgi:hypothetical protein
VGQEDQVTAAFNAVQQRFGRLDLLFNNAGMGLPPTTPDLVSGADWRRIVDANLNGSFYCLSNAFRLMKAQSPMGGPHHQQRQHLGLRAAAGLDRLHGDQARGQRPDAHGRARRPALRHRGRPDRHRQCRQRDDRAHDQGVPQADGSVRPEPRMDLSAVVDTFLNMARLPLSANVLFTTVMATKMPFVGRG